MAISKNNIEQISLLCSNLRVATLYLFEAEQSNHYGPGKLTFTVRFESVSPESYIDHYYKLKFALKDLVKTEIILLEEQSLSNPFLKQFMDSNKNLIYGRQNKGMAV
jgi:uncharacterized protein